MFFLVISLWGSVLFAKGKTQLGHPSPIHIKFDQHKPVGSVKIGEKYLLHLEWKNRDNQQSYDGYFVLKVNLEKDKVELADLECIYEDQIIEASITSSGIEYHFPVQKFVSHESGVEDFSVIYYKPGKYNLDIAIAQG